MMNEKQGVEKKKERAKRHNWTFEECAELSKECDCPTKFKEKYPRAYKASIRNKWITKFTWFNRYCRSVRWTEDACYKEAKKYKTRMEFQNGCEGAYKRALKMGWLNNYDWLIPVFKPKGYWNDYLRVKEEAEKYSSRTEFYKGNQFAYYSAIKNGWMDDFIPLKQDVNEKIRCVYSYEFEEIKTAYVGLTIDKKRRHQQHKGISTSGKSASAVIKFVKQQGIDVPDPIYWFDNCTIAEAQKYENEVIRLYSELGWKLINKAKTGIGHGAIGVIDIKWTKEECFHEAQKYHSRKEFSQKCQSAYSKALQKGWINEYTWFSTIGNRKWTYETCYNEALKYKTRWEFGKANHSAYQVASKNKWLDDYHWFVKPTPRVSPIKWTYETCKAAAENCSTRSEFVRLYKGAYEVSRKNGWLDEFIPEKMLNQYSKRDDDPAQYTISFE